MKEQIAVRKFGAGDSVEKLTELLHRSFARLGAMGLNYTAVDQSAETTRERVARGECYLAIAEGSLVGTVLVEHPRQNASCKWFADPATASAHQLAVEPLLQRQGIGSRLMDFAEQWAQHNGYCAICIDTAEPAQHLVRYYASRGYEHVDYAHWEGKRYRSVIMRKTLRTTSGSLPNEGAG